MSVLLFILAIRLDLGNFVLMEFITQVKLKDPSGYTKNFTVSTECFTIRVILMVLSLLLVLLVGFQLYHIQQLTIGGHISSMIKLLGTHRDMKVISHLQV